MISFTDALSELRRKALLTGQPVTNNELKGIETGWFNTATAMSAKERAQKLAEDKLAQERQVELEKMNAANKAGSNQLISNIGNNAVQTLGMDYIKSKPGESMVAKGAGMVTDLFSSGGASSALNTFGGSSGVSSVPNFTGQTFTGALNAVPAESMGFAAEAAIPEIIGEIASGASAAGEIASGAAAAGEALNLVGTIGSALSSYSPLILAPILSAGLKAAGGNNDANVATQLGASLDMNNWFGSEGSIGGAILKQAKGFKDTDTGKAIRTTMDVLNPVAPILRGIERLFGK
jgi:hypothetical protein